MNANRLKIIKATVSTIVGIGTAKIVQSIIENNVDTDDMNTASTVSVKVASVGIGYMASDLMSRYTDHAIDKIAMLYTEVKTRHHETRKTA